MRELYYHHCNTFIETTLHVTRDCPLAVLAWMHITKVEKMGTLCREFIKLG